MLSGYGGGFAVVDLEATGSSSRRHRVVELAVVLLGADLSPQGEYCTLIDPEGPVGASHIHGIERCHLGDAPRFAEIAPWLLGLLRGRVLVGHNVGCDRAFLVAEYARVGVAFPDVPEVCTMRMATQRDPAPGGFSLRACAEAAGVAVTGWSAHTALGDARTTARLFARYVQDRQDWQDRQDRREGQGRRGPGLPVGRPHAEAATVDGLLDPGPALRHHPEADRGGHAATLARAAALDWPAMAGSEPWMAGSVRLLARRTGVRRRSEGPLGRNVSGRGMVSSARDGGA